MKTDSHNTAPISRAGAARTRCFVAEALGELRWRCVLSALIFVGSVCLPHLVCPPHLYAKDQGKVDFSREIQPIIEAACLHCHCEQNAEGNLRLDSMAAAIEGGDRGPAIVVGDAASSELYTMITLAADDDDVMPPSDEQGGLLSRLQIERIRSWIDQGADWPEEAKLKIQPRIDFIKHIQPILEQNCLACHDESNPEGDLHLDNAKNAFRGGDGGVAIVPFRPDDSPIYTSLIMDPDGDQADALMPPENTGGPLSPSLTEQVGLWIRQGAHWPRELQLIKKAKTIGGSPTTDTTELLAKIRAKIVAQSKERQQSEMKDYQATIPLTNVPYAMVAIKGGEMLMGSPITETGRTEVEGSQTKVTVGPFWIGRCEVTWDEYEPYMITQVDRYKNGSRTAYDPHEHSMIDAVSQPTPPYMEMSFGMGQNGYPAISMTQHAANKYCQWLSAQTGHFYRLPTEAEWEYACRAGTTTAYSFGDDPTRLGEYAWYYENSNEKYQKVGMKKPNPWGIHDMHGNVMEWTADAYDAHYYERIKDEPLNPFLYPETLYPRSVRGGHWDDDAELLRSAARRGSDAAWKTQDPQLPKSIWYHTDARSVGFRMVRPLDTPTVKVMDRFWNSAVDKIR